MYKLLQQAGFKADFTAGHSFGELTALWAAGVFTMKTPISPWRRHAAKPWHHLPTIITMPGRCWLSRGMLLHSRGELKAFPEITLANWNSNNQVVLAGTKPAIAAVQKVLVEKGYSVVVAAGICSLPYKIGEPRPETICRSNQESEVQQTRHPCLFEYNRSGACL